MPAPGHLFIVHGDLTRLACDAWLLPTDGRLVIESGWRKAVAPLDVVLPDESEAEAFWSGGSPVRRLPHSIRTDAPDQPAVLARPDVWLGNIGSFDLDIDGFVAGATGFLAQAAADLKTDNLRFTTWRARPLLALPVLGVGKGGGWDSADSVLDKLIGELLKAAHDAEVDVALVSNQADVAAAAQRARARHVTATDWQSILGGAQQKMADHLANQARNGKLVLFLGAGVSMGAGLPSWRQLMTALGGKKFDTEQFRALGLQDQATLIERSLEKDGKGVERGQARAPRVLAAKIVELFDRHHVSLVHQLLAGLPVDETVTTNYDTLFEMASEGANREVSVLPHAPKREASRWLLKMHGCVTQPDDIVLTREDYLRYDHRRAALAGIVQALLITKHMLFVGFSLEDDNFHRIIDAVRRALRPAPGQDADKHKFGTVLFVTDNSYVSDLWEPDLHTVQMVPPDPAPRPGLDAKGGARQLEILLDYLGAKTTAPAFLGHKRFDKLLTDAERSLRDMLKGWFAQEGANSADAASDTRAFVASLARKLGVEHGAAKSESAAKGPAT